MGTALGLQRNPAAGPVAAYRRCQGTLGELAITCRRRPRSSHRHSARRKSHCDNGMCKSGFVHSETGGNMVATMRPQAGPH